MLMVTSSAGPGRALVDQFAEFVQVVPSPAPVQLTAIRG